MDRRITEEIRIQVEGAVDRAMDRRFEDFRHLWLQGHGLANFALTFGTAAARRGITSAGRSGYWRNLEGQPNVVYRFNATGQPMQGKDIICRYAQHLERFAEYMPVQVPDLGGVPVMETLSEHVGNTIIRWLETPNARFLWVDGLLSDPQDGVLPRLSMQICHSASAAGLPVVLFFRRRFYSFQTEGLLTAEDAGLIALLYSLILQFVNLLPNNFPARSNLSQEMFRRLDGSLESAEPALQILEALLDHAPQALVCAIDGLERLETPATKGALTRLVEILRSPSAGRRFKILFTTTKTSGVLPEMLNVREQVLIRRPTRSTAAGRALGGLEVEDL
ncbi:hypothetical protein F5Y13DRAFT_188520 [Hypoxylon sp. FL1857]|nr:hypothetical protein F5Y13DRAFT_188520 [Hypoxylon sp. FL1857]